jgi:membrane protein implicated in regulation of membrane protease activity
MDSRRGANWANIGAFFVALVLLVLGLLTYGLMLWSRYYPDPTKAPAIWEGLMKGTLPFYVAGVCLFLASVVQVVLFRRLKQRNNDTGVVRELQRQFSELDARFDEKVKESNGAQRAFTDSQSALAILQQKFDVLQARDDEFEWLREIADEQRENVRSYLRDDAWEVPFHDSVLIEPLFIDFRFVVYSSSVFPLSATGISGAVRFANDRLTGGKAEITRNELDDLKIGQPGWLTITQPLNRADAVRILNQSNTFYFDQVTVELTSPRLEKAIKLNPRHSVENKALLEKYPKLDIKISEAYYDWILAFGTNQPDKKQPCYVTLYLTITNGRTVPIYVETFRLTLVVKGKEYVSFSEDRVYRRRYVNDQGIDVADGEHSQNLNKPPLVLIEDKPTIGTLQFIFNDLDWLNIIEWELDDSLNGSNFTLLLTDKDGEKHFQHGTIQHRDKVKELFVPTINRNTNNA